MNSQPQIDLDLKMDLEQDPAQPAVDARIIVLIAVVVGILIHGTLLLMGTYEGTYDSYVHIFFAQKYSQHWFNPWVYNWFEGFDMVSYPPLVHQLVAILSRSLGLGHAYIAIQLFGLCAMITGVYRFSSIWLDQTSASLAASSAVFLTSYAQAIHHFGQLPSSFAAGFALHGGYYFFKWVSNQDITAFLKGLAFLAIVVTSHHLTFFLFAPILMAALSFNAFFEQNIPQDIRIQRVGRIFLFAAACAIGAFLLLQPFISYVRSNLPSQLEIPHATRQSFLKSPDIFITFFAIPMATVGIFLFSIPTIATRFAKFRVLAIALFTLLLFGLGGTTPLPKLLLGKLWGVLTYDRFTMWSTLLCLPFVGFVFQRVKSWWVFVIILGFQASIMGGYFLLLRTTKFQPDKVDFSLTAKFLNEPSRNKFRYLTLGAGCQFAKLSTLTSAASVDGLYYTARTPKILRESGIEAIDFSKYFGKPGEKVLSEYLNSPETYSLKYVIVNDAFYNSQLEKYNWKMIPIDLGNGLKAWETPKAIKPLPLEYFTKVSKVSPKLRKIWGSYPFIFFFLLIWELITFLLFFNRSLKEDHI